MIKFSFSNQSEKLDCKYVSAACLRLEISCKYLRRYLQKISLAYNETNMHDMFVSLWSREIFIIS